MGEAKKTYEKNQSKDFWDKADVLSKIFSSCFLGVLAIIVPLLLWNADRESKRLDVATKIIPLLVANPENPSEVQRQKLAIAYLDQNNVSEYRLLVRLATEPGTAVTTVSSILEKLEVLTKGEKLPGFATLERTSDNDLDFLPYATRYRIRLKLGEALPAGLLREENRFLVWETGNVNVVVRVRSTRLGLSNARGEYERAMLWGDFSPDKKYTVGIFFPSGKVSILEARKDQAG